MCRADQRIAHRPRQGGATHWIGALVALSGGPSHPTGSCPARRPPAALVGLAIVALWFPRRRPSRPGMTAGAEPEPALAYPGLLRRRGARRVRGAEVARPDTRAVCTQEASR